MIAYSDATVIVGIVAAFFLLLALIALARTVSRRFPPSYRRFRVGVFVERDDGPPGDGPAA